MALVSANLVGAGAAVKVGLRVVKAAAQAGRSSNVVKAGRALAGRAAQAAGRVVRHGTDATKSYFRNGNNWVRIGNGRVSLGPAYKHYKRMPRWQKALAPIHVHIERRYGGIDFNWIRRPDSRGVRVPVNWTLWRRG